MTERDRKFKKMGLYFDEKEFLITTIALYISAGILWCATFFGHIYFNS